MVLVFDITIHCQFLHQSYWLVSSLVMGSDKLVLEHQPSFPLGIYLGAWASAHIKVEINEDYTKTNNKHNNTK